MKYSAVLFSLLAVGLAAPSAEPARVGTRSSLEAKEALEARAPSCKTGADDCVHACAGGSEYINCYGSYVWCYPHITIVTLLNRTLTRISNN